MAGSSDQPDINKLHIRWVYDCEADCNLLMRRASATVSLFVVRQDQVDSGDQGVGVVRLRAQFDAGGAVNLGILLGPDQRRIFMGASGLCGAQQTEQGKRCQWAGVGHQWRCHG